MRAPCPSRTELASPQRVFLQTLVHQDRTRYPKKHQKHYTNIDPRERKTAAPHCMPPKAPYPQFRIEGACASSPSPQNNTCTSTPNTPNCMPPSTQPTISQITCPSLLEVRTPIASRYLRRSFAFQGSLLSSTGAAWYQHLDQNRPGPKSSGCVLVSLFEARYLAVSCQASKLVGS